MGTHMYRSSDSLLTRISLIRSILKSSPSMSSMVVVESAMETISSSANEMGATLASRRGQLGAEDMRDHRAVTGTLLQTQTSITTKHVHSFKLVSRLAPLLGAARGDGSTDTRKVTEVRKGTGLPVTVSCLYLCCLGWALERVCSFLRGSSDHTCNMHEVSA